MTRLNRFSLLLSFLLLFISLGASLMLVSPLEADPIITATKTDALAVGGDNDGDGQADPGDTLEYTVIITNSGITSATNVVFSDTIDSNTTLVEFNLAGSDFPTSGSAWADMSAARPVGLASPLRSGETVNIDVGTLDVDEVVTITIRVTIDTPATAADLFGQVCNQGKVAGTGFSDVLTDDPDTGTADDATCTPLDRGTIVIRKDAVPDSTLADFNFSVSGGLSPTDFDLDDDTNGTLPNEQIFTTVASGQYTVTESNPQNQGFTLADIVCEEGPANIISSVVDIGNRKATINLDAGETITCTFTNEKFGSITVEKQVVGSAPGDNWVFVSNIPQFEDFTLTENGSQGFLKLQPGLYAITETLQSNYNAQVWCDSGDSGSHSVTVDLQPGLDVACTFTNTHKTGQLTLVKDLAPAGDSGRFNLRIDGNTLAADVGDGGSTGPVAVEIGSHTVGETAGTGTVLADYGSSIECRSNEGQVVASANDVGPLEVTVEENDDIVCTITNIKNPGRVVIATETVQPHPQNFTFTTTLPVGTFTLDDPAVDDMDGVTDLMTYTVLPDTVYTITETDPTPYGFQLTGLVCVETDIDNSTADVDNRTATLRMEANETVTCTFTNTAQAGTLRLTKIAAPPVGTDFGFTSTLPGYGTFTLDQADPDDGDAVTETLTVSGLDFGVYTVTEEIAADFELVDVVCDDAASLSPSVGQVISRTAIVHLDPGETVTCRFRNNGQGAVYLPLIVKGD